MDSSPSATTMTEQVIPILPCQDIRKQVEFYQLLGFAVLGIYTSPNPYAALKLGAVQLHFYGTKKMVPAENPSMCYIKVADVDAVNSAFASALKRHTGKVSRSGIPRISKVRDLVNDRRFTLTDAGGNTLYIGNPKQTETGNFFRTLDNKEWAKKFTVLYDLLYSKEDCSMAAEMLPKFNLAKDSFDDLDKAKLLLVALEIRQQLGKTLDDSELKVLLKNYEGSGKEWKSINKKYHAILQID